MKRVIFLLLAFIAIPVEAQLSSNSDYTYNHYLLGLTTSLIAIFFSYSLYSLFVQGKILLFPNIVQPVLFSLLHLQIYSTLGASHYQCDFIPGWYDWFLFTGAHILRAVDILDLIEEYGIHLQYIKHASTYPAVAIIAMHWMMDIFLLSIFWRFLQKMWKPKTRHTMTQGEKQQQFEMRSLIIVFFLLCYISLGIVQQWSWGDFLFWWFADNIIRSIDVGDAFQLFHWTLHNAPQGWAASLLAVLFRLLVVIYLGKAIDKYRFKWFGGKSVDQLIEDLNDDEQIMKIAAERLAKIVPSERISCLLQILRNVGDEKGKEKWVHGYPESEVALEELLNQDRSIRRKVADMLDSFQVQVRRRRWKYLPYQFTSLGVITALVLILIHAPSKAKEALPRLMQMLKSTDNADRVYASKALGTYGIQSENAVPLLVRALTDDDYFVRKNAEDALSKINPAWNKSDHSISVVPALIERSSNKNIEVRIASIKTLGKIGAKCSEQVIPVLIEASKDEQKDVRVAVVEAFETLGVQFAQTIPSLSQALEDTDYPVSIAAAKALRNMKSAAIPSLIKALGGKNYSVQEIASQALIEMKDESLSHLMNWIRSSFKTDDACRKRISEVLVKIGAFAITDMTKTLINKDSDIRSFAADILDKINPSWYETQEAAKAIPELKQALQDKNFPIRANAVKILGKIKNDSTLSSLIQAIQDKNFQVRAAAAQALAQMSPKSRIIPVLSEALKDKNSNVVEQAVKALGECGPEAVLPLTHALKNDSLFVRQAAVKALGKIGYPAISSLIKAFKTSDWEVSLLASEELEKVGDPAIPDLTQILLHEEDYLRENAAKVLGKIGQKSVPSLIKALADKNFNVRLTVSDVLGNMGSQAIQAIPALTQISSSDENPDVRNVAKAALAKIRH